MRPLIWSLSICLLLITCGYREGIVQKADRSYFKFTGNWANATVKVDEMPPFLLVASASDDPRSTPANTIYQISPGKHRVTIVRSGQVLVDRVVFVENQATMEIQIP